MAWFVKLRVFPAEKPRTGKNWRLFIFMTAVHKSRRRKVITESTVQRRSGRSHSWMRGQTLLSNRLSNDLSNPFSNPHESATATKFHISFFPFFLPRITYRHVRCPFVQKEKIKKVSFIKISPFEKWNLPSAIARNWFQLSPLFSQRQLYLWRHLPNTRLMIAWF